MKNARQKKILEIIEEFEIGTQEALIGKLREFGFEATQTTVSRDIRQLHLVKGPTGMGTYKYVAPSPSQTNLVTAHNSALTDSVIRIEVSQNIVVIKTNPGMANAIGVCIDTMAIRGIIGSVAGDDTILIVVKDNETGVEVRDSLRKSFSK